MGTNLNQLADEIRDRFLPLAAKCACRGDHESCRAALNDPAVWTQLDTVERIAVYIRSLA